MGPHSAWPGAPGLRRDASVATMGGCGLRLQAGQARGQGASFQRFPALGPRRAVCAADPRSAPLQNQLAAVKRGSRLPRVQERGEWSHMEGGTQPRSPLPLICKHHLPDDSLCPCATSSRRNWGIKKKQRILKKDSSCSPVTVVSHNFSSMHALCSFSKFLMVGAY